MAARQAEEASSVSESMKTQSKRIFDEKAKDFDSNPVLLECTRAASQALRAQGVLQAGQTVMDFGCGTGLLSVAVADGCRSVVGVDSSEGMVQVLQDKIGARDPGCNVHAVCCELQSPDSLHAANDPANPFPETFDLIVSSMTFHHIDNIYDTLRLLAGHLKAGGRMAVFDFQKGPESMQFHKPETLHTVFHPGGFAKQELCNHFTGVGLTDVSCQEVATFKKPRGDNPKETFEYELLMALGTKPV